MKNLGKLGINIRTVSLVALGPPFCRPIKQPKQRRPMKNSIKILSLLVAFAAATPAQQKPDPAGIVRLFSVDVAQPENSPAWTNVNIDGMRLRPDWNDVQPSSTTFDWSSIDNLMDL